MIIDETHDNLGRNFQPIESFIRLLLTIHILEHNFWGTRSCPLHKQETLMQDLMNGMYSRKVRIDSGLYHIAVDSTWNKIIFLVLVENQGKGKLHYVVLLGASHLC